MSHRATSQDPFGALADPNRRAIVELLRPGQRSVREIADELPISRPAVSQHLRILKRAGLVTEEARGTRRLYRLHDAGADAVRAYLELVWGDAAMRFRLTAGERSSGARGVIEPIRLAFEVECPADHAFATWTERTSTWWPSSHTVTASEGLEVRFEPRVGGRIFERTPGGDEHEWGEITAWEPPDRLRYLWHLRADRADATEVEIRFLSVDDDRTRVEIEHRGWERLGAADEERRDRNRGGWAGLLPHYIEAANRPTSTSEEHT